MNIFSSLKLYAGTWSIKSSRVFNAEEKNAIRKAVVVTSQYGNSVCFMLVNGGKTYIPLDNSSSLGVGEEVDMNKAKLLVLTKAGESDIYRVKA